MTLSRVPTFVGRQVAEPIQWTVDGTPIRATDDTRWEATSLYLGGADRFAGVFTREALPSNVGQGAKVVGYRTTGEVLWYGRLAMDPYYEDEGYRLNAVGEKALVERRVTRLPYQIYDPEAWAAADSEPHNYGLNEKFEISSSKGRLAYRSMNGESYNATQQAGFVIWVPGWNIKRVQFKFIKSADIANFGIRTEYGTGPGGSLTNTGLLDLSGGGPASGSTVTHNIGGNADLVRLSYECTTTNSPGVTRKVTLTEVRVSIIGDDDWQTNQVASDVGARAGLDPSLVQTGGASAMPLDWAEGSWAELLNYLALLDDWRWEVREPRPGNKKPRLFYGPAGERTWHAPLSGSDENLIPEELFNRVVVSFERPSGTLQEYTAKANPDPLKRYGAVNEFREELPDRRKNQTLAAAVANNLVAKLSQRRVRGTVNVPTLQYQGQGVSGISPYALRAGDKLLLGTRPALPAQEVQAVVYSNEGVRAELGREVSASRLIARALLRDSRHPGRRQGKRGKVR